MGKLTTFYSCKEAHELRVVHVEALVAELLNYQVSCEGMSGMWRLSCIGRKFQHSVNSSALPEELNQQSWMLVGSEVDPGAPESISKVMGAVNDKHD
ncbi:hypothetical protein WN944_003579 [Citrus x changshan-huyou]|uniref:Uncharacterized protein n=1 Tax=Citrus x changshan-huyou TaxID=2935761 RepID=A0AAP0QLA9_9ROSI